MIEETRYNIGERVTLFREQDPIHPTEVRIMRFRDGHYFNFSAARFEALPVGGSDSDFRMEMVPVHGSGVLELPLETLPHTLGRLLVEFDTDTLLEYKILSYGGADSISGPDTCLVYGRVLDLGGAPIPGQRVEVLLNNGGYFPHKSGLLGTASYAMTDSLGYFELPLVHGLDVVISVPTIGFTQRGVIPPVASVEIKGIMPRR